MRLTDVRAQCSSVYSIHEKREWQPHGLSCRHISKRSCHIWLTTLSLHQVTFHTSQQKPFLYMTSHVTLRRMWRQPRKCPSETTKYDKSLLLQKFAPVYSIKFSLHWTGETVTGFCFLMKCQSIMKVLFASRILLCP